MPYVDHSDLLQHFPALCHVGPERVRVIVVIFGVKVHYPGPVESVFATQIGSQRCRSALVTPDSLPLPEPGETIVIRHRFKNREGSRIATIMYIRRDDVARSIGVELPLGLESAPIEIQADWIDDHTEQGAGLFRHLFCRRPSEALDGLQPWR